MRAAHSIRGSLAAGGQINQTALLQFNQQGASRHVFELARVIAPRPARGQLARQTPATPAWILPHPLADQLQVPLTHRTALHDQTLVHGVETYGAQEPESSPK
jgi:hypothetical protein